MIKTEENIFSTMAMMDYYKTYLRSFDLDLKSIFGQIEHDFKERKNDDYTIFLSKLRDEIETQVHDILQTVSIGIRDEMFRLTTNYTEDFLTEVNTMSEEDQIRFVMEEKGNYYYIYNPTDNVTMCFKHKWKL